MYKRVRRSPPLGSERISKTKVASRMGERRSRLHAQKAGVSRLAMGWRE